MIGFDQHWPHLEDRDIPTNDRYRCEYRIVRTHAHAHTILPERQNLSSQEYASIRVAFDLLQWILASFEGGRTKLSSYQVDGSAKPAQVEIVGDRVTRSETERTKQWLSAPALRAYSHQANR